MRDNIAVSSLKSAMKILNRNKKSEISIGLCDQVQREFKEHYNKRVEETKQHLRTEDKKANILIEKINAIKLQPSLTLPNFSERNYVENIQIKIEELFSNFINIPEVDQDVLNAHNRVSLNKAPSQRGKESSKDCLVIESYLRWCRDQRSNGNKEKIVFLTSNVNDFSERSNKSKLNDELVSEFTQSQLEYAVNYEMVEHFLK